MTGKSDEQNTNGAYVIPTIEIKYQPTASLKELPNIGTKSAAEYFIETWDSNTMGISRQIRIMVLSKRYRVLGIYEPVDCPNIMRLDPKYVFMAAINNNARAVAVAMTHDCASQSYNPDLDELSLLNRLLIGGKALGIDIWDFILITPDTHFSFREHGCLDKKLLQIVRDDLKARSCQKQGGNLQTVLKPVSLESILKKGYYDRYLDDQIENLCKLNDPLKDEVCCMLNGPLADEVVYLLAIIGEKLKQSREAELKLQSELKKEKTTLKRQTRK